MRAFAIRALLALACVFAVATVALSVAAAAAPVSAAAAAAVGPVAAAVENVEGLSPAEIAQAKADAIAEQEDARAEAADRAEEMRDMAEAKGLAASPAPKQAAPASKPAAAAAAKTTTAATNAFVYVDHRTGFFRFASSPAQGDYAHGPGCWPATVAAAAAASNATSVPRAGGCSGLVAWGAFIPNLARNGWDELSVETSARFDDGTQAFAAGFLEGSVSHRRIWEMLRIIVRAKKPDPAFRAFLVAQDAWLRSQVRTLGAHDAYWLNVGLVLRQLDGLLAGYNSRAPAHRRMTLIELWQLNDDGDKLDIERAVEMAREKAALKAKLRAAANGKAAAGAKPRFQQAHAEEAAEDEDSADSLASLAALSPRLGLKPASAMTRTELLEHVAFSGHCSALIKLTKDDVLMGHTTFSDYDMFLRMYKSFTFHFHHPSIVAQSVSFTSYPAFLWSSDDFLVTAGAGGRSLVVLETTITLLNETLYEHVGPTKGVMTWVRTLVANRVAADAKQWVDTFTRLNSGTYCNSWQVIDMARVREARRKAQSAGTKAPATLQLPAGSFYLVETLPGLVESRDMTAALNSASYFASYNLPYFRSINEAAMYANYSAKFHTEQLMYARSTRAKIFAREQASVKDVPSLERLLRLNDYLSPDSLTRGCPSTAVAARYDLSPRAGARCEIKRIKLNGAIDGKILSAALGEEAGDARAMRLVSGPTTSGGALPPFDWNAPTVPERQRARMRSAHTAVKFEFPWVTLQPHAIAPPPLSRPARAPRRTTQQRAAHHSSQGGSSRRRLIPAVIVQPGEDWLA